MRPGSTYRLQLRPGLGFAAAAQVVPYLRQLGVTDLYSSPFLQAALGSTHGYDVADPSRLDIELGGQGEFGGLAAALNAAGLGHIADIVPNHMSTASPMNWWWWDVLENGLDSPYARYFDIDWRGVDEFGAETVLAPILADHYGRVLDNGEITVGRDGGCLVVRYNEYELPLSPRTYSSILEPSGAKAEAPELIELSQAFDALPDGAPVGRDGKTHRRVVTAGLQHRLLNLCHETPSYASVLDAELASLGKDADRLDDLLLRQNYRLVYWRSASEMLDYRRFFNIVTLVGLRVEDDEVFADSHRLVMDLIRQGAVTGLRIDHVDGLRRPSHYLSRLRAASGGVYTVVEKILAPGEQLPGEWTVEGTTGYDFLNRVNGLFVEPRNEAAFTSCYEQFTGDDRPYPEVVRESKRQVLEQELPSEVERLSGILHRICGQRRRHRDRTHREVHDSLIELIVNFPAYRCYVDPGRPVMLDDRELVQTRWKRPSWAGPTSTRNSSRSSGI